MFFSTHHLIQSMLKSMDLDENLNIDLKSKGLIWATKDIFVKRSLVTCK